MTWSDVPAGTAELVLLVDDPDAPMEGSFVHWVVHGLSPSRAGIGEGEQPAEAKSGTNGFGAAGYLGPAPPPGHGVHHYVFRLLALDAPLAMDGSPAYDDVAAAANGHVLAEARLVGTYER